ncbi:MAG: CGNR zinc finger domain-containing protein [Steroidobacteraceae bacterium]
MVTKPAKDTASKAPFQLLAGHPALDFVNTLDNRMSVPIDLLERYADLLRFAQAAGLIDARQTTALAGAQAQPRAGRVLRSAQELREALASLFYTATGLHRTASAAPLDVLKGQLLAAARRQELVWTDVSERSGGGARAAWEWGRHEANPALPVWIIAQSAARLMTSDAMRYVRMCDSETCRWLFLDTSKNHSRRWCDMKICGNRMKARRFQARAP